MSANALNIIYSVVEHIKIAETVVHKHCYSYAVIIVDLIDCWNTTDIQRRVNKLWRKAPFIVAFHWAVVEKFVFFILTHTHTMPFDMDAVCIQIFGIVATSWYECSFSTSYVYRFTLRKWNVTWMPMHSGVSKIQGIFVW